MKFIILLTIILNFSLSALQIDDLKKSVFQLEIKNIDDSISIGSAVSLDGKLVTAYHVISDAQKVVVLINNKYHDLVIGNVSIEDDLAFLTVSDIKLNIVTLNSKIQLSDKIHTLSGDSTLLQGTIAKLDTNGILISYSVPQGNSGGGVFNSNNELIAIISKTYINEGVTFATTIDRFDFVNEKFKQKEPIDLSSNNYDYSYCHTEETIDSWKKIITNNNTITAHTLHAIFLGLCEKVKRKEMTTEVADYVYLKNRERLFGI